MSHQVAKTSDMKLIVTGATGLVGSHVILELERRSIPAASLSRRAGTYMGDLLDPEFLSEIPWSQFTHVIHCAAAIPARSTDFASNISGTRNLLSCLPKTLASLVFVSSISAGMITDYGSSKLQCESLCLEWAERNQVGLSIFRPTSIFGKGMAQSTILPSFVRLARDNKPLLVTAPFDYNQNFVWAGDVARILVDAAEKAKNGIWDLCSDFTMNAVELAEAISMVYGGSVQDARTPATGQTTTFDNSPLKRDFSIEFTPFILALRSSFEG